MIPTAPKRSPRAFVAAPVDASGPAGASAELTVLALGADDGLLERALEDTGATGEVYLLGAGAGSALVVELRGPDAALDAASAQVRALLGRLARGAVGPADLTRATAMWKAGDTTAHLQPRRRLIDLWRGATSAPAPTLAAWRTWLSTELRDERVAVLVTRAPAEATK